MKFNPLSSPPYNLYMLKLGRNNLLGLYFILTLHLIHTPILCNNIKLCLNNYVTVKFKLCD